MSLGFAIVACGCAFCAGIGAMLVAEGHACDFREDLQVGRVVWAVFTGATIIMIGMGVWSR